MARITVEDCIDKVANRFELVLLAAHRARMMGNGSAATIDPETDKNTVVALEKAVPASNLLEGLIHSMRHKAEIDEPETSAAPSAPSAYPWRDDPSRDTQIDVTTEDALLRVMKSLVPEEPSHALGQRTNFET